jgi:hypothetical protein
LGHCQPLLGGADEQIGPGHIGDQGHHDAVVGGHAGIQGGRSRLDLPPEAPPDVGLPGEVEAQIVELVPRTRTETLPPRPLPLICCCWGYWLPMAIINCCRAWRTRRPADRRLRFWDRASVTSRSSTGSWKAPCHHSGVTGAAVSSSGSPASSHSSCRGASASGSRVPASCTPTVSGQQIARQRIVVKRFISVIPTETPWVRGVPAGLFFPRSAGHHQHRAGGPHPQVDAFRHVRQVDAHRHPLGQPDPLEGGLTLGSSSKPVLPSCWAIPQPILSTAPSRGASG